MPDFMRCRFRFLGENEKQVRGLPHQSGPPTPSPSPLVVNRNMDTTSLGRTVSDLQTSAAGLVSASAEAVGYGVETLGIGDTQNSGLELHDLCAKRVNGFAHTFSKRLESSEQSVLSSSDALRGDVLNSVIMADANATSEIPSLVRATTAAKESANTKLAELKLNAHAAPALRLEMLEHCAERRLRMERKYLQSAAPKEERFAREMRRAIEGKTQKESEKDAGRAVVPPSLLGN